MVLPREGAAVFADGQPPGVHRRLADQALEADAEQLGRGGVGEHDLGAGAVDEDADLKRLDQPLETALALLERGGQALGLAQRAVRLPLVHPGLLEEPTPPARGARPWRARAIPYSFGGQWSTRCHIAFRSLSVRGKEPSHQRTAPWRRGPSRSS